ncbi:DUF4190 domain-containing protein [Nocardioides sp.]|uniref:DUF4190 domain-containing protein n=1 Tax=Nocardioides sp. TaxID=35761 RepID=UPI002B26DFC5|nr:DUF4190 domain-containing protein [Nocardioides sp.]
MSYNQPPPPPPGYGAPEGGYGAVPPQGTNKKAIWSLVTGIVGFLCCGILIGPVAIFLSIQAKKEIEVSGEQGGGMATAGLVLGILGALIHIVLIATGNFLVEIN